MSYSRPNPLEAAWYAAIDELIVGNGVLEVVSADTPPLHQRVRPFVLERLAGTDRMIIERPRPTEQHPKSVPFRSRVDIYLHTPQLRLVAAYEVGEAFSHQLNERQRITALHLTRVGGIGSAQRRAYFRVDTSAAGFGNVTLNPADPELQLKPISGHLLNLSAGGVGIRVDQPVRSLPDLLGKTFDFLVSTPGGADRLAAAVTVRRVNADDRSRTYLGVEFEIDRDDKKQARLADAIAQLTTQLQREQLRKRRTA